jgi:hypothetical protein
MAHTSAPGTVTAARQQALHELDAVIEQAECTRTRYLVHVEELAAAGKDPTHARAMLREAEDRLVRLRKSRAVLVTGELAQSGNEDG